MTGASALADRHGATQPGLRLWTALAVSLLLHLGLAGMGGLPSAGPLMLRNTPVLQVSIPERALVPQGADPVQPDVGHERNGIAVRNGAPLPTGTKASAQAKPAVSGEPLVLDDRFFGARELDRYPAPLTPLGLKTTQPGPGVFRFWVGIDQFGNVLDVTASDPEMMGGLRDAARQQLLDTRFSPAIKNNRPVRSRILLEMQTGK